MEASISDLRYKTKKIMDAINRNEKVSLTYRGKLKAVITPVPQAKKTKMKVEDHPMFGCRKDDPIDVEKYMEELRKPRYQHLRK